MNLIKEYVVGLIGLGAACVALLVLSLASPLIAAPTCKTSTCDFYNGGQDTMGNCGLNSAKTACGCVSGGSFQTQASCGNAPPA